MSTRSASTPALQLLTSEGVRHEVHRYHHEPGSSNFGAEAVRELTTALGCDPAAVFKTLVWLVDDRACFAVVPVAEQVSAKRLAGALNAGTATLADQRQAERISGSVPGAISPLAPRKRVPVVIDTAAGEHEQIFVSAGRRGLEIALAPRDLIAATDAIVAAIVSGARER